MNALCLYPRHQSPGTPHLARFSRDVGYHGPCPQAFRGPTDLQGCPSIRKKALSRAKISWAVRSTALFVQQREWDRDSGISPLNHFSGGSLHRTIDTTENYYHDSSIRTSSRRVCAEVGNTGGVFQGACAVFCIDRSGCESTQSMFRARLRPGAPAGCSRYERSPDS